ncbi:MAG TPA: FAD-binding oxidoreductase [Ktedonobacterales bacterium]
MGKTLGAGLAEQERQAFAARLAQELGADQSLTGAPCAAYAIQGLSPVVVARPATTAGVETALRLAAEAGAAVAPWGNGSRMALGYPPRRLDMVLSLERLDRVVAYDPADLTITVEAGMTHETLAQTLFVARQMLPLDPPLPRRATIGGTLATGIVGMRRSLYGAPRDVTLGMRVVDAAGQSLKAGGAVVKNATGYGMTRLYVGSLGTLCVITEASFKLAPAPEAEMTLLAAAPARQAFASVTALNALAVRPSAMVAMHIGALPELARLVPGHERRELLAIRMPGTEAAVKRAIAESESALRKAEIEPLMTLDGPNHAAFWASANDFPALRIHPREALVRVSTLPDAVAAALDMANSLADEHRLSLFWVADLATGTLWLRLSAPSDNPDGERDGAMLNRDAAFAHGMRVIIQSLIQRWRHVTTLACPVQLKTDLPVWGADPAAEPLMREIKRRFDPANRLNPGRFVSDI